MNPRLLVSIAALAIVAVTAGCNSKPAPTNPSPTDVAATLAVAHTPGPDQTAASANSVDWSCLAQSVAGASGATWRTSACSTRSTTGTLHISAIGARAVLPNVPINLTLTVGGSTVTLQWSASPGAASYIVEAGSAPGLTNLANFDTGNASTVLTALNVPPATYYVRVRARNDAGTTAPSNEALAIVRGAAPCGIANAPTTLTAAVSGSSVTLSWAAPIGGCAPTGYVIQAGSAPGLSDLANFSTGSLATSFSAAGVGAGTYYVRVRAATGAGTSGPSNEVSFTNGSCPVVAAPTGLTSSVTGSTVTLTWTGGTGACAPTSYLIQAGSSPGSADLANISTGNAATTFTAGGVGAGTYYIRIAGRVGTQSSSPSNEIAVVVGDGGGCAYTFSPPQDSSVPAAGRSGSTSLKASCSWTLSTDVPWIMVTSATTGSSSGSVTYSVAPNAASATRTGHVVAQGAGGAATFTVTQIGVCGLTVSATSLPVDATGPSQTISISTSAGSCTWSAVSASSFVTVTSGSSGIGDGKVTLAIQPNVGLARTGTVTIAGQVVTINQDAPFPRLSQASGCGAQSGQPQGPTQIQFINLLSAPLYVSQLSGGNRMNTTTVAAQTGLLQSTNVGAVWVVEKTVGDCFATVTATTAKGSVVVP
jgi:hypothetical protein